MPERKTKGAGGYDVGLRALVSARKMEPHPTKKHLRLTLYDFSDGPDTIHPDIRKELEEQGRFERTVIITDGKPKEQWVFWLKPGGRVTGGIGFVTAMMIQLMYWVSPRSGLASKLGITLANAPGTVDWDYRGEACVIIVNNGSAEVALYLNMRIAQVLFWWAILPIFIKVDDYWRLSKTDRGEGGLGSTGGYHDKKAA